MLTRIREFREKKKITQEDLAKRVGVTRQTIIKLEKGDYNPSLWLAYDLSVELGVAMEALFVFVR